MTSNGCVSRGEIDALGKRIAEAAAYVDLATHRLLTDIRAFDEAGGWHLHGAKSCAAWLSWRGGISLGPAREHVRVAAKLGAFPAVDAAMAAGALSYSKARALTRVVTERNVELLLQLAGEMTAAQLEQTCRKFRRVQANNDGEEHAVERRRYLRTRDTDDGMVSIELALAEAALRGDKPTRTPVDVTVHIDADVLAGHTEEGQGVSAETCRRLCCDAGLTPVLEDAEGKTLDVGRKTRSIPAAIRRALAIRDKGCRFPGCTRKRFVDGHHVKHWINGGATKLSNLVSLCHYHHKHVHELGFNVRALEDGDFAFFDKFGVRIDPVGDRERKAVKPPMPEGMVAPVSGWDGGALDYGLIISALWNADHPPTSKYRLPH